MLTNLSRERNKMKNELVVIENLELVPFFTKGDNLESTLERIEKEMLSFVPGDLSVKKNRDAVKAMVTKVTSSKTYLEKEGKALAAEYKEIPKQIDANRKKTKDFLTELQAKVRQPLTEWEEEDKRIKAEEAARIEAEKIKAEIESDHEVALLMDEKFNRELADKLAEEARLEKERIEQEEKARLEREALIAQQAKEKAEQEAKEREDALERERLAAIEREEKAKRDAIAAEERAKAQAEEAERQRKLAEEKAKQDAIDAEIKRKADIEKAKREAEEKAERERLAEIQRKKDEEDRIAKEKAQREADKAYASKVLAETKESITSLGLGEEDAKKVTLALKDGKVANVGKIQF